MPLVRDQCICLRKFEYSETSQILTLFSREHGLMRTIAKGAHRTTKSGASKFGGGIDLLDLGDAVFTLAPEKDLATLCEWKLRDGHLALRRNLRAVYLGTYAAELVAVLIEEHDAHPELFDRLRETIDDLQSPRLEEAFLAFELDLLRETGYVPHIERCVSCQRLLDEADGGVFFSPMNGGAVCHHCQDVAPDRMDIDPRVLRIAITLMRMRLNTRANNGSAHRLPRLSRHQTDPLNRVLAGHIEQTLSKRLRLPAYVLGNRR
jgi:DNA repair protein RecO (recombination protein O)